MNEPIVGRYYIHYKRGIFKVLANAINLSDGNHRVVVFQHYSTKEVFTMDKSSFVGRVRILGSLLEKYRILSEDYKPPIY